MRNSMRAAVLRTCTLPGGRRPCRPRAARAGKKPEQRGLRGAGQVVGIGDTGVNLDACAFAEPSATAVPFDTVDHGRAKVVAYFTGLGDMQDSADGHGTHVAGIAVSNAQGAEGVAPAAQLAVVDLVGASGGGAYNVPSGLDVGSSYFDLFEKAGAQVVCSPWGFEEDGGDISLRVDQYAHSHPEFLAIFPSGNSADPSSGPHSPCRAKNSLCVGAAYGPAEAYLAAPSFVSTALRSIGAACPSEAGLPLSGGARAAGNASCSSREAAVLTAMFGPTAPSTPGDCEASRRLSCLISGAACPECAFAPTALASVVEVAPVAASPSSACEPLVGFATGSVCVVRRGDCTFVTKADHCQQAGAVGVIVVNYAASTDLHSLENMMDDAWASDIPIPVVMMSHADAAELLSEDAVVTFPIISALVSSSRRAPYSSYGPLPDGRVKPEVILPGDSIEAAAAGEECGVRVASGTSQACGMAAGVVALAREYLQTRAEPTIARQLHPWASTLKALLAAVASVDGGESDIALRHDVGFGLPDLAELLAPLSPPAADYPVSHITVQASLGMGQRLAFCLSVAQGPAPLRAVLAWTDKPAASGSLVNDLDLTVACDVDAWAPHQGNGESGGDHNNNLEKVVLAPLPASASCIVAAHYSGSTSEAPSSQTLSLVVAGHASVDPSCLAAAAAPPCGHGVAEQAEGTWRCQCEEDWAGPHCSQQFVGLAQAARILQPFQWDFLRIPGGDGADIVLEHDGSAGGDLAIFVSARAGPRLWDADAGSLGAAWDGEGTWADGGANFTATSTASAGGHQIAVQVQGSTGEFLYASVWCRKRGGAVTYNVSWRADGAAPVEAPPHELASATTSLDWRLLALLTVGLAAAAVCCMVCARLALERRRSRRRVAEAKCSPVVVRRVSSPVAWAAGAGEPRGPCRSSSWDWEAAQP